MRRRPSTCQSQAGASGSSILRVAALILLCGWLVAAGSAVADDAPAADRASSGYIVPAGRSPIPQPGETFDKPLPFKRLADPLRLAAEPGKHVPWGAAHHYLGQVITVEGQIVNTRNIGSVCFLNYSRNWRTGFYVVIFKSCFDEFPTPPQEMFLNKRITVTGKVTTHKGRPQIRVRSASQITLVNDDS